MQKLFGMIAELFGRIFGGLLHRILGETAGKATKALWAAVKWVMLILLFGFYEYGLYVLDRAALLSKTYAPSLAPLLRDYDLWTPLLGFLVLLFVIVLYFWYATWDSIPDESPFPDLDAVWNAAMEAVNAAGIVPTRVSLYLVLGRPATPETNLLDAAGVKWVVKHPANDPNAPLHVYAEKETSAKSAYPGAIYVTCRGASVLGKLAGILARDESVLPAPGANMADASSDALSTVGAFDRDAIKAREIVAASEGREATILEKRKAYRADRGRPLGHDLLADTTEVTRLKSRLAYLCQLIARERGTECAANGILLLIPLASTDTLGEAQLTAQACLEDLTTARNEMKIDCPVVNLLVDLEDLPGFGDFLSLQRAKELTSRRGGSFPMATRLTRDEVRVEIKKSLAWTCTTYMQDSIYAVFQSETDANKDVAPLFPRNARLTLVMTEMNERADAICDIVMSAMMPENEPMFRYSGFYLAATGAVGIQGFITGVFQKLIKEQASVTWTPQALDADAEAYANSNFHATVTYVLSALLLLIVAGFVYFAVR